MISNGSDEQPMTAIEARLKDLFSAASDPNLSSATAQLDTVIEHAHSIFNRLSMMTPDTTLAQRLLGTLQSLTLSVLAIPPGPFKQMYLRYGEVSTKLTAAAIALEELETDLANQRYSLVYPPSDGSDAAADLHQDWVHADRRQAGSPYGSQFHGPVFNPSDEPVPMAALEYPVDNLDQPDARQDARVQAAVVLNAPADSEQLDRDLARLAVAAHAFQATDVVLGKGGFGEVVQAEWVSTGTQVAIKRLLPLERRLKQNQSVLDMVAKEALVWSNLQHPHVLPLHGVCLTSDVPFLVMPLMAGGDLTRYAPGRPDQHLRLLHEAAQGMAYLHSKHIFHGDLKGNNILVDESGRAQVCDFGQSRVLEAASRASTFKSGSVGNVRWIAPERYKLKAVYQLEPDVFAYAMVMYEVISGAVPFCDVMDLAVIVGCVLAGERPSMPSVNAPAYLPLLWPLIEQCWAHDWTTRPTFVEIVTCLAHLCETPNMTVLLATATAVEPPGHPIVEAANPNSGMTAPEFASDFDVWGRRIGPVNRTRVAGDCDIWSQRLGLANGTRTALKIDWKPIGPAGLDVLQRALAQPQQQLTMLLLRANSLGPSGAELLAQCLPLSLTVLGLSMNQIGNRGAIALAAKLPPSLTWLSLSDNTIGDSGAAAIASQLPPLLTGLALNDNLIGDPGMVAIAKMLPPSLTELSMDNNMIGDAAAAALAAKLPQSLTKLLLDNNLIGDTGAAALGTNLPTLLTILVLSNNEIGDAGARAIAPMLPASLTELILNNNPIGDAGAAAIAANLPPKLKRLYLSAYPSIGGASAEFLLPLSLTMLNLSNCKFGDLEAAALALMLPSLTELCLNNNAIGDTGAVSIAAWLPPTLKKLALSNNEIGDAGAVAIANMLPLTLTVLVLSNNQIGNRGAIAIADHMPPSLEKLGLSNDKFADSVSIKLPPSMDEICLGDYPISDPGAIAIASRLPASLTSLDLSGNQIGDAGAAAIAAKLPQKLINLCLHTNRIGDSGASAIAAQLPRALTMLNLSNNRIGDSSAYVIAAKLPPALTSLNLANNEIGYYTGDAVIRQMWASRGDDLIL
ncbi:hypothetical protein BC828DRAFT_437901 [Blastocladiella britannica]|nr:hypothetical protein BC828DRAFT_437901 [Blastocladiella britannica]